MIFCLLSSSVIILLFLFTFGGKPSLSEIHFNSLGEKSLELYNLCFVFFCWSSAIISEIYGVSSCDLLLNSLFVGKIVFVGFEFASKAELMNIKTIS